MTTDTDGNDPCTESFCTLRAAVIKAHTTPGSDVIKVPAGQFRFGLSGTGEDEAYRGDPDITDTVRIEGEDKSTTVVNAFEIDRMFDIFAGFAEIRNLTIRNGQERIGAGIRISEESDLLLRNLVVEKNIAMNEGLGGGIANAGTLAVIDSVVKENLARDGGGIYLSDDNYATFGSSLVVENVASFAGGGVFIRPGAKLFIQFGAIGNNNSDGFGGGISNFGILRADSAKVADNTAEYGGGFTSSGDGDIHLSNVTMAQNEATNTGGAIDSHGNRLLLERCAIPGTAAERAGAIVIRGEEEQNVRILESRIESNTAARTGAIRNEVSGVRIERSTISNNVSEVDAAISNSGASADMYIENSTIRNNKGAFVAAAGRLRLFSATIVSNFTDPGGSALRGLAGADITSGRSIWHNPGSNNCALFGRATVTSEQFNIDSDGTCSLAESSDLVADPLLDPLADNGGTTFTHTLMVGSPARDRGDGPLSVCPPIDQRGAERPQDGDGRRACDVGAVEVGAGS
jgi:fibronectin-binding autotransporter adhesin